MDKDALREMYRMGRESFREAARPLLHNADPTTAAFAEELTLIVGEISIDEALAALRRMVQDRMDKA